jgi:hypothetical protein
VALVTDHRFGLSEIGAHHVVVCTHLDMGTGPAITNT